MISTFFRKMIPAFLALGVLFSSPAGASQGKIHITSLDWSEVSITTELAESILTALGYDVTTTVTTVPACYEAMASGKADFFLGNWMPSTASIADPYFKNGSVLQLSPILTGTRFSLAVPSYVANAGLRSFGDIVKFGHKLDWKIYGIEKDSGGNTIISRMIKENMHGLGKFELIESSETEMLAQVESAIEKGEWIVFLGWRPHAMNEKLNMTYLKGSSEKTFGANDGSSTVYINVRKDLPKEQPNVLRFLNNFSVPMKMMDNVMHTKYVHPEKKLSEIALDWLAYYPEIYTQWFIGVKTKEGKSGLVAFEAILIEGRK